MKTFITSDTHLFHKTTLKWDMRKRFNSQYGIAPEEYDKQILYEDTKTMNRTIISNWNSVVGKDDLVYHLGDVSFGNPRLTREALEKLNGKIILIKGNHDKWKDLKKLADLFVEIVDYKEIKYHYEEKVWHIIMMHYPIASWNRGHYGSIHLHGHSHGGYKGNGKVIDVGIDTELANFYPILMEDAIEYSKGLDYKQVVHH